MDEELAQPFYLIVTDHDRAVFSVEGPMTGCGRKPPSLPEAPMKRRIVCDPAGADRETLAAEYRGAHRLAGVPPGSIVRPRHE